MKPIDNGGTAFPAGDNESSGMSLRDWFAGQALVMLCTSPGYEEWHPCWKEPTEAAKTVALHAYMVADAMIAQRSKETP